MNNDIMMSLIETAVDIRMSEGQYFKRGIYGIRLENEVFVPAFENCPICIISCLVLYEHAEYTTVVESIDDFLGNPNWNQIVGGFDGTMDNNEPITELVIFGVGMAEKIIKAGLMK